MNMTFDYLIIGGGMTADAAAKGIREIDRQGHIGIVGDDSDPPYTRPALTKKLWTDPGFSVHDNWLNTADATGAYLLTGTTAVSIAPRAHQVTLEDGRQLHYGRLLLATGGVPATLDVPASERSLYFRSFADYRALRRLSGGGRHIAVVGGSYIGTELAAGLAQNDTRTTLIFPDDILGGALFPEALARRFENAYQAHGVQLLRHSQVDSGTVDDDSVLLKLSNGCERRFNGMVSGLGIEPCTALAEDAGLHVDNGIVVDQRLRTSGKDIYAAGDVACYPDRILGQRRVEHVDNATEMGAAAGRIMAGSSEAYRHTPYYYSQVFDMSWQAVGTLDSSLETVEDWSEPLECGVVYYLDGGTVAGVLLWNRDGGLEAARAVLADDRPQSAATLRGRI